MYHALQLGNASIIEVDDDLDIASSPALGSAIDMAAEAERYVIVLLEGCSFCDSTALGVLVKAKQHLGAKFLVVLPPGNRITRIFDVTGLTTHLKPSASLQVALDLANAFAYAMPPVV